MSSALSAVSPAPSLRYAVSPIRLTRFRLWVKILTIWTIICLLGTESNWELLAANCPTGQTPIDDTVRVTEYTYDIDGRVTQVCSPEGTITYEYDQATGRKTRTYTTSNDTSYDYDELGRLKHVTVTKLNTVTTNLVTTYAYTDVGSRESVEMPNGTRTTYEYNSLNRLTKVSILDSQSSILSSFAYTLHSTGRRTGSTEITRQDDTSYTTNNLTWTYDKMYRLTNETLNASVTNDSYSASYVYDLVGNRKSKSSTESGVTVSVASSFNSNDQLTTDVSTLSVTNSYTYDTNGSLTNQVKVAGTGPEATAYAYDLENRLSGATIYRLEGTNTVAITANYLYNPSGIRVRSDTQTQINGSPGSPSTKHTFYLVDSMNHTGYAQVLEESSSTGSGSSTLDRSYTIGDDVLSQSDGSVSPATRYLGYDGHGSTRILTDSSGSIASGGRYNYDAYGVSLGSQPSTVNPSLTSLLYTGEQFDTGLQQYYLRARYYSQIDGRFNQLDPFAGNNFDPQSLHKYSYAHDDPVNRSDPSGYFSLVEIAVVAGLVVAGATFWYTYVRNGRNAAHAGIIAILAGSLVAAAIIWSPFLLAAVAATGEAGMTVLAAFVLEGIHQLYEEVTDSDKTWEERLSALFLLLSYGVATAAPEVNAMIPQVNRMSFRVAPGLGAQAIKQEVDAIVLGLAGSTLDTTASTIGARTLTGDLKPQFNAALANPKTQWNIEIQGMFPIGGTPREKIMNAVQAAAAAGAAATPTNWEMLQLFRLGLLPKANIYENGVPKPNPFVNP